MEERDRLVLKLKDKIREEWDKADRFQKLNIAQNVQTAEANQIILERDRLILELHGKVNEVSELAVQLQQFIAERDAQIMAANCSVRERDRCVMDLNRKVHEVSDWASHINSSPFIYGFKKYSVKLKRSIFRSIPISIRSKQKIKIFVQRFISNIKTWIPERSKVANASKPETMDQAVLEMVTNSSRDVFIFSVIDWNFRIQRPQHLAQSFAKSGKRVFYFSNHFIDSSEAGYAIERVNDLPNLLQIRLHVKGAPAIYFDPPTMEAEEMLKAGMAKLIMDFDAVSTMSLIQHGYWYPTVKCLPNTYRIYDCMDNHDGFGNVPEQLIAIEKNMLAQADLVVVTSSWLENFASAFNDKVAIVRNAGEYEHFANDPVQIYSDAQGRRVIGYYGAIAEWFDLDLVRAIALQYKNCLVLLVGNDTVGANAALNDLSNVVFTGEVPYARLPFYLYAFDVCLLPFKVIPLTLATNPVKVYEYLAAGKPVVCVDLPEISQFKDLVWRAKSSEDFIRQVALALNNDGHTQALQAARRAFAKEQTWDHRTSELDRVLNDLSLPKISVIVLTYNNLDLTKECLNSLLAMSDYPNLEIIIVDNASSDETPLYLMEFGMQHEHARIILNESNLGFAAGNNIGLAAATGNYFVILNNDTVVTRGWALTMLRHLQNDKSIGLIGPVTNNIGNEARVEMCYKDIAYMQEEASLHTVKRMGEIFSIPSAAFFCVMMPRTTYDICGPISEDYGRGFFEDDDYCRKVQATGLRVVCADDVFIHHHLSASFNKLTNIERQELMERNRVTYEKKWGPWVPHRYRQLQ